MTHPLHQPPGPARLIIICLLTAVPLALLIQMVGFCGVNVPVHDEWHLVDMFDRSYSGTLTWDYLWLMRNEHRIFFPLLLLLGLGRLSHWDLRWELWANVAIVAAVFGITAWQIVSTSRRLPGRLAWWLLPLVSLVFFSLSQLEMWVWGITVTNTMSVFFVVSSTLLLANSHGRTGWVLGSLALAVCASFSFGTGLAVWPAGALCLLGLPVTQQRRWRLFAFWFLAGAICVGLYFQGYNHNPARYRETGFLETWGLFANYFCACLGGPVSSASTNGAMWAGVLAIYVLIGLSWYLVRSGAMTGPQLLPYWVLAIDAALMTGFVAVGRFRFSAAQAMSSRYVIFASPLWVSVACVLWFTMASLRAGTPRGFERGMRLFILGTLTAAIAGSIIFLNVWSGDEVVGFREQMLKHHEAAEYMRGEMHTQCDYYYMHRLNPKPDMVRRLVPILMKWKLSDFHDPAAPQATLYWQLPSLR
ncbi:MAG: hypothetical protein K1X53_15645 [Candidatus Sumerlaeaceae bacterium]|nr:hypothetical protein [Candidatus Sumerlaeaceae bacterium]